jgi:chromosome segregation ATPase
MIEKGVSSHCLIPPVERGMSSSGVDVQELRGKLAARDDEVRRLEQQLEELEARFVDLSGEHQAALKSRDDAEADASRQRE